MTDREAMKLAEEALEELHYSSGTVKAVTLYKHALAAIREALAEQFRDATKMVGCAYCDNPLFAGTKCNNCGRVTLAEPVKLRFPTHLRKMWSGTEVQQWLDEQVQPVKQEPIGYWQGTFNTEGYAILYEVYRYPNHPVYAAPVRTKDLTDAEKDRIALVCSGAYEIIDAAIAADREKNK